MHNVRALLVVIGPFVMSACVAQESIPDPSGEGCTEGKCDGLDDGELPNSGG